MPGRAEWDGQIDAAAADGRAGAELVGDRDTGIIASIAVLSGHDRSHDGPFAGAPPQPATTTELDPVVEGARHVVPDAPGVAATSCAPRPDPEPVPSSVASAGLFNRITQ
jgi:hypothetical protein